MDKECFKDLMWFKINYRLPGIQEFLDQMCFNLTILGFANTHISLNKKRVKGKDKYFKYNIVSLKGKLFTLYIDGGKPYIRFWYPTRNMDYIPLIDTNDAKEKIISWMLNL